MVTFGNKDITDKDSLRMINGFAWASVIWFAEVLSIDWLIDKTYHSMYFPTLDWMVYSFSPLLDKQREQYVQQLE